MACQIYPQFTYNNLQLKHIYCKMYGMSSLFDKLYKVVEDSYYDIGAPESVLAAISGGADSIALLYFLRKLELQKGMRLMSCHVHHGLRETADRDAIFVQNLCEQLQTTFVLKKVELNTASNVEAEARVARYNALNSVKKENNIDVIATGHHMQDQAETVLLHLMYGSGSTGLSGMYEYRDGIWRPLLSIKPEEIYTFLHSEGIEYCFDETNEDESFMRNAIRKTLIPSMLKLYPRAVESMSRCAGIIRDEAIAWREYAVEWLSKYGFSLNGVNWIWRSAFNKVNIALKRHILRALFNKVSDAELSFEQVENFRELIESDSVNTFHTVRANVNAYITKERVHLYNYNINWNLGIIEYTDYLGEFGDGIFTQALDADKIAGSILRFRREGDRIHPLGAKGSQSLKQYMIDKKIDMPFRDIWPLLAKGNEIIWVIGYGVSQNASIRNNTENIIMAKYGFVLPDGNSIRGGKK